jgi:hypothetical protein
VPTASTEEPTRVVTRSRASGIVRVLGRVVGTLGSIVVTLAVALGAMVYLMVAWSQHRRRGRAARA